MRKVFSPVYFSTLTFEKMDENHQMVIIGNAAVQKKCKQIILLLCILCFCIFKRRGNIKAVPFFPTG